MVRETGECFLSSRIILVVILSIKKKMTQTHLVYSIKMPQGNLHTGGKWICAEKS